MEGLGQKNGDREIYVLRCSPSGCVSDFGKIKQSQASIALRAMTTAAWRIMRISQNSSAFHDVRRVMSACERDREMRDRELQGVGEEHWRTPASVAGMEKVRAVPDNAEGTILRLVR